MQLRGVSTHGLAWYPQYMNQEFFTELREVWGANVVRLATYSAEEGGYALETSDRVALNDLVVRGVQYDLAGAARLADTELGHEHGQTAGHRRGKRCGSSTR